MKAIHQTLLLFVSCGLIIIVVNYMIKQYIFILAGTALVFIGFVIPIFFEDKKQKEKTK